ncbi:MAG: 4Fe-4S ferredoxin, partial [Acidobacteria bacterium]|nr:4Fe-4S ferredoxin [Acidobacteriota bacterium]
MMQLAEHPTVKRFYELEAASTEPPRPAKLDSAWLRQLCLEAGADDAGFVEMERPEIADQR